MLLGSQLITLKCVGARGGDVFFFFKFLNRHIRPCSEFTFNCVTVWKASSCKCQHQALEQQYIFSKQDKHEVLTSKLSYHLPCTVLGDMPRMKGHAHAACSSDDEQNNGFEEICCLLLQCMD
jgi:hypothetical protein